MSLDRGYVPRIQILGHHFRLYKTSQNLYFYLSIVSHLISPLPLLPSPPPPP
jgi:hypothetical protein